MNQRINVRGRIAGVILLILGLAITTRAMSAGIKPDLFDLLLAFGPGILLIAVNTIRPRTKKTGPAPQHPSPETKP